MGIRTVRGELNISPSIKLNVSIKPFAEKTATLLMKNLPYIKSLAKTDTIEIGIDLVKPEGAAMVVKSSMEIFVLLKGVLNITAEIERLRKEISRNETSIASLSKKLSNDDFLRKAPKDIIEKEKKKYEELIHIKEKITESIKILREAEVNDD
jgi:valyl-tRNA synthetase